MKRTVVFAVLAVLSLVAAACDRGEETPGTTLASTVTTGAPSSGSAGDSGSGSGSVAGDADGAGDQDAEDPADDAEAEASTTTDPDVVAGLPSYEVVERVEADQGEELVIVVEPGTYTNVELQNLVFDIVDRFAPVTATVVDDPAAAALVFAEERSPEDEAFLEDHMFLELVDGVEVTFKGPYSELKGLIVGS